MKKIEITLNDKLKFLANAHFYDAYLDNKSYRGSHLAQIGFYSMAVVTCALSAVLSPSLAIAGIGALCVGMAISHDEYKTKKAAFVKDDCIYNCTTSGFCITKVIRR